MNVRKRFLTCSLLWLATALTGAAGCARAPVGPSDPLTEARHRLAENPADPRTQLALSELYLEQRDYLRARQYLQLAERGLQQRPREAGVDAAQLFRLGITIAVRSQQFSDAIRRCEVRLEQAEDPAVRGLLATLLEATGSEGQAERQLRLLVRLDPRQPRHLIELARFYERSGIPERRRLSRELYQRYLDASPEGDDAPHVRAVLAMDDLDARADRN